MKQYAKLTLILVSMVTFLLLPAATFAQNQPKVYLSSQQLDLQVGQQATVDVLVEGASAVYGTELHLLFDPTLLEVVEVNHGDFLAADPDNEAFVLQNKFNNETGTIDYAVSLLNPAPPVNGNGALLRFTVRAKAEGPATIEFVDSLFGTQTGEEVAPSIENLEMAIAPGVGQSQPSQVAPQQLQQDPNAARPVEQETLFRNEGNESSPSSAILGLSLILVAIIIGGIGLVIFAGLIGAWLWLSRSRQNKRPRKASA